jgi:hypothetical protein
VLAWEIAAEGKQYVQSIVENRRPSLPRGSRRVEHNNIEFVSFRENVDTGGPLGRAKLEGRRIGREPLDVDRSAVLRDRARGLSLAELAKQYRVSRSSICRVLRDAQSAPVSKGVASEPAQLAENKPPKSAA